MNQPVKTYSFNFVVDGTSESLTVDLSLLPVNEDFKGSVPVAILNVSASSTFTGSLTGVTAVLSGTTVTLTFSSAPPEFDGSSNRVVYTASLMLTFEG